MNNYPRKSLGCLTPIEKFNEMNKDEYILPSFIIDNKVLKE
jgi:hypothetical protein